MRIFLIILAVLQFLFAGFAGAVGGFADGGEIWERAVLMGIHPLAAIGLLVLAVVPGLKPGGTRIVQFLLALNIVADGVLAALIYSGVTKGRLVAAAAVLHNSADRPGSELFPQGEEVGGHPH